MFRFEKLDVWQRAVELATKVYSASRSFPADERFGLTAQIRRPAVSISSNIAEGSSRSSDADFARFIEIAYGSLMEVVSQAVIAQRELFIRNEALKGLYKNAEELARMLSGLRAKLVAKSKT